MPHPFRAPCETVGIDAAYTVGSCGIPRFERGAPGKEPLPTGWDAFLGVLQLPHRACSRWDHQGDIALAKTRGRELFAEPDRLS